MKRTPLGTGQKSIERGSTFASRGLALERTAGLKRSGSLKRSVPKTAANPHLAALNRRLAFLFHDSAQRPCCPICHEWAEYLHAHHCVERGFLERELEALVTPERLLGIVWDARNALGACGSCHMNDHWSARRRITRGHLPASAWEFAKELDELTGDARFTVRLEAYGDTTEREAA